MEFDELKKAILNLDQSEQKRLITEVLPAILPQVCTDESCLGIIRNFINEESIKTYKEQHMGGI
ncbi:MAG: hypothetical protein JRC87_09710 [Deltaproteobacteria bacterium]|nr:hypothetical protein [Deltaproteobacteria bacterium]